MAPTTSGSRHLEVAVLAGHLAPAVKYKWFATACGSLSAAVLERDGPPLAGTIEVHQNYRLTIIRKSCVSFIDKNGSWRPGGVDLERRPGDWHPLEITCRACRRTHAWKVLWWLHHKQNRETKAVELDALFMAEGFDGMGSMAQLKEQAVAATLKTGKIHCIHSRGAISWTALLEEARFAARKMIDLFRSIQTFQAALEARSIRGMRTKPQWYFRGRDVQ